MEVIILTCKSGSIGEIGKGMRHFSQIFDIRVLFGQNDCHVQLDYAIKTVDEIHRDA